MQNIEDTPDVDIAEAYRSAEVFGAIENKITLLNTFLSLIHAFTWLNPRDSEDKKALHAFYDGQWGDPIALALGQGNSNDERLEAKRFTVLLTQAQRLITEERFFNWQVAFPGVWSHWQEPELHGGFDAVIGHPPWNQMKLPRTEWFANPRRPEIAMAPRAFDQISLIQALIKGGHPLAADFAQASKRAEMGMRVAREWGDYPKLSGGDINLICSLR